MDEVTDNNQIIASDDLVNQMANLISPSHIDSVARLQRSLSNRFEKSNETLSYCNDLSNQHYQKLLRDFRRHTQTLTEMYRDLDSIFHRIRTIKQRLRQKYPNIMVQGEPNSQEETDPNDISEPMQKLTVVQNQDLEPKEKPENE